MPKKKMRGEPARHASSFWALLNASANGVWVDDVLPPVIGHAAAVAGAVRQESRRPDVVGAGLDASPHGRVHDDGVTGQVGEVLPHIPRAGHLGHVAPVVVAHTVGRKVNDAHLGFAWGDLVVAAKAFE